MSEAPRTGPLPGLTWLADDFQRRWRRGECIVVEAYLQEHAAPPGEDTLLDLIHAEVVLREERGEAPSLADISDPQGRVFRAFAEQTRSDLRALAACIRGSRQTLTPAEVGTIRQPTLVAVGTKDGVAGSAQALAALLPNGRALDIPNRDHMQSVGDKVFKTAVLEFLAGRP